VNREEDEAKLMITEEKASTRLHFLNAGKFLY